LCIILLLLSVGGFAQTVFVNSSTWNDDAGNGSSANPYKTLTKGYAMASAEGTLNLTGTFYGQLLKLKLFKDE